MTTPPFALHSAAHGARAVLDRRELLARASSLAALFSLQCTGLAAALPRQGRLKHHAFEPVPLSTGKDASVFVPKGYVPKTFFAWGTPVDPKGPAWTIDGGAKEQQQQAGMHHDGMAFFPADARWNESKGRFDGSSTAGILAINHEYTDEGLLHRDGYAQWTAAKVAKSKAAVGVSIIDVASVGGDWQVRGGTRITAEDPIEVCGPARGSPLLATADGNGTAVAGTFANCACGQTSWGTYLTCEENFQDYFARTKATPDAFKAMAAAAQLEEERLQRYGIGESKVFVKDWRSVYGWDAFDPRFNADNAATRNHCNRFGWVVEIDPRDPKRRKKCTALGRFRHENAAVVIAPDRRVVVYMGDDARFEYIYKFVSARVFDPQRNRDDASWTLLDEGTLYVARFDQGDTGRWLPLVPDAPELKESGKFPDLATIAVFARQAADLVHATKMDRPEWIAVDQDPTTRSMRNVYVSLTNNSERGVLGKPGPDAANPRADNVYGHVLRWRETDGDPTATTFQWGLFVLAGNRMNAVAEQRGTIKDAAGTSDQDFGSPDGLTMDPRGGVLWVQTDVAASMQRESPYRRLGHNQMVAIDVATGEVRRFLTGPSGCEITGLAFTPDCKTMFVNIQHPGEVGEEFSDAAKPLAVSSWPDGKTDGRPRSATVVVTRSDGGEIGT